MQHLFSKVPLSAPYTILVLQGGALTVIFENKCTTFLSKTIKLPSESTGLIIISVTGSRGTRFGPLFAQTVPSFETFSLLADVLVGVCCNKLNVVS